MRLPSFAAVYDLFATAVRPRDRRSGPKPLAPVSWSPNRAQELGSISTQKLALRLHSLRPDTSVEDFAKQVRNPIASRCIAVWVKLYLPQMGVHMMFDTRADNPQGMPASLRTL